MSDLQTMLAAWDKEDAAYSAEVGILRVSLFEHTQRSAVIMALQMALGEEWSADRCEAFLQAAESHQGAEMTRGDFDRFSAARNMSRANIRGVYMFCKK